jgi:integrase
MASKKLKPTAIAKIKKPGYYGDGDNLWLQVRANGGKSWVFRYTFGGKAKMLSFGLVGLLGADEARELAVQARKDVSNGIDPGEARKRKRAEQARQQLTFKEAAEQYIENKKLGWKNAKHAQQWENTLAAYAFPKFGKTPVGEVTRDDVMECLKPIWENKNETASRLRGRIESILDWATVLGYRTGDNPARWEGGLKTLLPAISKTQRIKHHPALPFAQISGFMVQLKKMEGYGARALEFCILTAARSGEVRGATWSEIDMDSGVWIIPKERMKAGKEHRIPLSGAALKLLRELPRMEGSEYLFPSPRMKMLSDMSISAVLKRMKVTGITVHGFRSTFRDWAGETTSFPREVVEHALAHQLRDQAEAAYARGTLLAKRLKLMEAWASYCEEKPQGKNVMNFKGAA